MCATEYRNLDTLPSFAALGSLQRVNLSAALTPERIRAYSVPMAAGLTFNYAARPIDERILGALESLAREQQLVEKYRLLIAGEVMNTGERRKVLHHLVRGQLGSPVVDAGRDLRVCREVAGGPR